MNGRGLVEVPAMLSGQGRDGALEVATIDHSRHEPPGVAIGCLVRFNRAAEDPVIPHSHPMPGRSSSQRLDVEVGLAGGKRFERLSDAGE